MTTTNGSYKPLVTSNQQQQQEDGLMMEQEDGGEMGASTSDVMSNNKVMTSSLSTNMSNGSCLDRLPSAPSQSNGDCAAVVAKPLSSTDVEIIRIIGQHLRYLGLNRTFDCLASESGCTLEDPNASKLRLHVLSGQWDLAEEDLDVLKVTLNISQLDVTKMKFLLFEQKYLEVLEAENTHDALDILRNQITPLRHDLDRVHKLTLYLMCNDAEELRQMSKWPGRGPMSRSTVLDSMQALLPTSLMVPPKRLLTLLSDSVKWQVSNCKYHNTKMSCSLLSNVSLLTDHLCSREDFPTHTTQILTEHSDEVWFCQFSPDGKLLATGSKDGRLIVYDVNHENFKLTAKKTLNGPTSGVSFFSWSPDSSHLAVCGPDDATDLWVWNVETGDRVAKMNQSTDESLTCVSWHADSTKLACGGIKGHFYTCRADGHLNGLWDGVRVQSLACLKDNTTVLAADTHQRIRSYNFDEHVYTHLFLEEAPIVSFVLDSTASRVLVNLQNQGINLWDMESKCRIRKFRGVTQSEYSIYSCFGGLNENFVASGSEDSNVYIWHESKEEPIQVMTGHSATLNCVHWNPTLPSMLASASDDSTVRIWGPRCRVPSPPSEEEDEAFNFWKDTMPNSAQGEVNGSTLTGV